MKETLLIATVSILLSACYAGKSLDRTVSLSSDTESVFVIGVKPDNFRLLFEKGEIEQNKFYADGIVGRVIDAFPTDGYIVGKAKEGQIIGLVSIFYSENKSKASGGFFSPCGDQTTMIFSVPGGKVIYLGDYKYQFKNASIGVDYRVDIDSAKKFISEKYPNLSTNIEYWEHKQLSLHTLPCS